MVEWSPAIAVGHGWFRSLLMESLHYVQLTTLDGIQEGLLHTDNSSDIGVCALRAEEMYICTIS